MFENTQNIDGIYMLTSGDGNVLCCLTNKCRWSKIFQVRVKMMSKSVVKPQNSLKQEGPRMIFLRTAIGLVWNPFRGMCHTYMDSSWNAMHEVSIVPISASFLSFWPISILSDFFCLPFLLRLHLPNELINFTNYQRFSVVEIINFFPCDNFLFHRGLIDWQRSEDC